MNANPMISATKFRRDEREDSWRLISSGQLNVRDVANTPVLYQLYRHSANMTDL